MPIDYSLKNALFIQFSPRLPAQINFQRFYTFNTSIADSISASLRVTRCSAFLENQFSGNGT
jgi:hypothetical protein